MRGICVFVDFVWKISIAKMLYLSRKDFQIQDAPFNDLASEREQLERLGLIEEGLFSVAIHSTVKA
jgi:hypothetical protein